MIYLILLTLVIPLHITISAVGVTFANPQSAVEGLTVPLIFFSLPLVLLKVRLRNTYDIILLLYIGLVFLVHMILYPTGSGRIIFILLCLASFVFILNFFEMEFRRIPPKNLKMIDIFIHGLCLLVLVFWSIGQGYCDIALFQSACYSLNYTKAQYGLYIISAILLARCMHMSSSSGVIAYAFITTLIFIANTSTDSNLAIMGIVAICLLNVLVRIVPKRISSATLLSIYVMLNFLFIAIVLYMAQQYGLNLTRREEIYFDLYETIRANVWGIFLPLSNESLVNYYSFHNESVEILRALGIFGGFAFFYLLFRKLKGVERVGGLPLVLWILITSLVVSPLTTPYTSALVAMIISFYRHQYFSDIRYKNGKESIDGNDFSRAR